MDLPSAPFSTYYQADLTIAGVSLGTNVVTVIFAAPSDQPDDLSTPPTNYTLQSSPVLGNSSLWKAVGAVIVGDDSLHRVEVPVTGTAQFFRLDAQYFGK